MFYVVKIRDRWALGIRCMSKAVADSVCLQLNRVGVPKIDGHYVRDTVTWVVRNDGIA